MLIEDDVEKQEAETGHANKTRFLLTFMEISERSYLGKQQTLHFFMFSNETIFLLEAMW